MEWKKTIMSIGLVSVLLAVFLLGESDPLNEQDLKLLTTLKQIQPGVQKGIDRFESGDLSGARRVLEKSAKILPQHPDVCFFLSQISYRENDFSAALGWIEKAEAGFKQLQAVRARLNQSMIKIDQDKKEKLNDYALDLLISSQHAQCSAERLKLESNQLEEKAKEINPEQRENFSAGTSASAEFSYVHGNVLFRLRRFPEAEVHYLDAIRVDPRHANAYNNLINLYLVIHRLGSAREYVGLAEKNDVSLNPALVETVRKSIPVR